MLQLVQSVEVPFMSGIVISIAGLVLHLAIHEMSTDYDVVLCCFYSDKPGRHNFDLLKKLVLTDGSVLRAQLPGRPTIDSLFVDPARDGTRFVITSISVFIKP